MADSESHAVLHAAQSEVMSPVSPIPKETKPTY